MIDLDMNDIEDVTGGIATGEQVLTVTGAELKETRAGTGLYIKVEFTAANNQKHWENYNIKNPNQVAEKIGKSQLKNFLLAAGYQGTKIDDVNKFLGLKVLAKIKVTPDTGYGEGRAISSYKKVQASAALVAGGADPFV